ncbi:Tumor necrosis factor receptor superfamily member 5 [Bagarius yarrelli]|uniref:Tumor necrosis factor receptor superfamily member 5 n=1 Tax=Bagarius yarrelli TaxID=175774 RepID=A0A556UFH5_BAGYA|nr:Tumor necrosis factor receptor superfamily member 5 [Bagarius yarrelli]
MIFSLKPTLIFSAIFLMNIELCFCACALAEYEINKECCPMCGPGTAQKDAECDECAIGTYSDGSFEICKQHTKCEDLGLTEVKPGTATLDVMCGNKIQVFLIVGIIGFVCVTVATVALFHFYKIRHEEGRKTATQGLAVKTICIQTSNTVCSPLEGFYCTDEHESSCRYAIEHTKCSPGQYINQKGTALKDVECAECAEGTFSNGSLQICKQHTKCNDLGLNEITPGTNFLDAQCGQETPPALLTGIIAAIVVVLVVLGAVTCIRIWKHRTTGKFHFNPSLTDIWL